MQALQSIETLIRSNMNLFIAFGISLCKYSICFFIITTLCALDSALQLSMVLLEFNKKLQNRAYDKSFNFR
jgi:hypothetical protein